MDAKRVLFVAECPHCRERKEYPFADEVPKESFCQTCEVWVPTVELSWDGVDFTSLLPPDMTGKR